MKKLIDDELWPIIEPLLSPHRLHPKGGRPFVDDRAALTGIVFVLKTGIPWMSLPAESGCGGGVNCLHRELLHRLAEADRIDWSRACVDAPNVPAKGGTRSSA